MMFIAGIVGGVVVGVVAHGDYSDHSDHHLYSDSKLAADIESKRKQKDYRLDELERIEKNLLSKYAEEISILEDEPVLADKINSIKRGNKVDNINNINKIRNDLLVQIKNKLEKELVDDKKQLAEIDSALVRINAIQLTNKR